ncbi:hypothetical protein SYJ56_00250 [Algoriphagus sp. D3-2-R+10]|uniref:hypothetical protein n=1 Tax=Algoriphagus aurantiacus TaxID=3103948 RepID=UPI002B3A9817|nr:hypothetical protein [Algoriphagus sp. D3-2-R+10]MEB2773714.1 hypothetical protein [Algoriphagus sp. D3-2-R+10]
MKKALLTYILISAAGILAMGQDAIGISGDLRFDNISEKELWEAGHENPYLLFRAVQADRSLSDEKWDELVAGLDKKYKKKGTHINILRQVFQKSHQLLFKTYEQHSTFNDMLDEGRYDCVSASAALALLLDRYGFEYKVVETDYHVFIVVNYEDMDIILESTLPVGGMITAPSEVALYLEGYKAGDSVQLKSLNQRLGAQKVDLSDNAIFRKVNLTQLAGLQYYNDAISHFNEQSFEKASKQLNKALVLYNSERIEGLKALAEEQANLLASSN